MASKSALELFVERWATQCRSGNTPIVSIVGNKYILKCVGGIAGNGVVPDLACPH